MSSVTENLSLRPSEKFDQLIKWLGLESAEHLRRVRSVHIRHSAKVLSMVWDSLEESYGSAEAMESALFNILNISPRS